MTTMILFILSLPLPALAAQPKAQEQTAAPRIELPSDEGVDGTVVYTDCATEYGEETRECDTGPRSELCHYNAGLDGCRVETVS